MSLVQSFTSTQYTVILESGRPVFIQLPALAEILVTLDLPMEIARSSLRE
jgi:hypothetical protein